MNRRMDLTHAGGLQIYQDTLAYLQNAYSGPADALAHLIGDKVVFSGLVDQGATVTDGWISYGGEILPFIGGLKAPYIIVEQIVGTEEFADTIQRPVFYTRRLKFGNVVGEYGGFLYAELSRIPLSGSSIKEALTNVQRIAKSIINFEPSVILEGCAVDAATPGVVKISAGAILFNGGLTLSPAYEGSFPAYVSEAGAWSTVQPASGLFVVFDPHTSQRYRDVLRRFQYQAGDILISNVLSDRFDLETGIGRWEWKGFRLSADLKGRTIVGYWFGSAGSGSAYDPNFSEFGHADGEVAHSLTAPEGPPHSHPFRDRYYAEKGGVVGGGSPYRESTSGHNGNIGSGGSDGDNDTFFYKPATTDSSGSGLPHNNMMPYKIMAIIERDENL